MAPVGDSCDCAASRRLALPTFGPLIWPRMACKAIWRCLKICNLRARSRLYIGPNLLRPPRIRSARTAAKKRAWKCWLNGVQRGPKLCFTEIHSKFKLPLLIAWTHCGTPTNEHNTVNGTYRCENHFVGKRAPPQSFRSFSAKSLSLCVALSKSETSCPINSQLLVAEFWPARSDHFECRRLVPSGTLFTLAAHNSP